MEQSSLKAKITHVFKDFATHYVSVVFAWHAIVYGTIVGILLIIPIEYLYYEWITDSTPGLRNPKHTNVVITDKEIESARGHIEGMQNDYTVAKMTHFDIVEPSTGPLKVLPTSITNSHAATSSNAATSTAATSTPK